MKASKLARLVWQSVNRNRQDFLFSSVGIIIGISTLLFFTSLGTGIKDTVLEEVFTVRQIEIQQKTYEVGAFQSSGLFGAKVLDDDTIAELEQLEGVSSVYPKMKLTFPTGAFGGKQLIGKDVRAEMVADGIPDDLVSAEEATDPLAFKDWDDVSCQDDAGCEPGFVRGDGGFCKGKRCAYKRDQDDPICEGVSYCDKKRSECLMPIPVVASPQMLEIYNGSIHTALSGSAGALSKLPKLSKQALVGFEANVVFGKSFFLGPSAKGDQDVRRIRLVGFSNKAINIGATMPIGYVKRLNAEYNKEEAGQQYHSIVIETSSNDAIASVAQHVEGMGFALSDKFENAQRASLLILLITLVFNLISVIILAVAAVNIMHTFLMIILERRQELGLMRALGATRGEIRVLVLSEATVLGLCGAVFGSIVGWLATVGVDRVFQTQVQDFPFKPETLFSFEPWMFAVCLGAALVFCWLGALLPALRASKIDPAAALTGH